MKHIDTALHNARPFEPDADDQTLPVWCSHEPKLVTLAEWGMQLPHGIVRDGIVQRSFTLKKPTAALDVAVGDLRKAPGLREHTGRRLMALVATVTEEIAGVQTGSLTKQAESVIGGLPVTDVIYILGYRAALKNRGRVPTPAAPFKCAHCGGTRARLADPPMGGVKVGVYDWTPDSPPVASVLLQETIAHAGSDVDAIAAVCTTWAGSWGTIADADDLANEYRLAMAELQASVCGYRTVDGKKHDAALPPSAYGQMASADFRGAHAAVRSTWGGLVMAAPYTHDCGNETLVPFDWKAGLF